MVTPDFTAVKLRTKQLIAQMVVDYQNKGEYLDLNGKRHFSNEGIVSSWNEYEKEFGEKL